MITKGDKIAFAIIIISVLLIVVFWDNVKSVLESKQGINEVETKKEKKDKKKEKKDNSGRAGDLKENAFLGYAVSNVVIIESTAFIVRV